MTQISGSSSVLLPPLTDAQRVLVAELLKNGHTRTFALQQAGLNGDWKDKIYTELIRTGHFNGDDVRLYSLGAAGIATGVDQMLISQCLDQIPHLMVEGRPLIRREDLDLIPEIVSRAGQQPAKAKNSFKSQPRVSRIYNSVPIDGDYSAKLWEVLALNEIKQLPPYSDGEQLAGPKEIRAVVGKHLASYWCARGLLEPVPTVYRPGNRTVVPYRQAAVDICVKYWNMAQDSKKRLDK